MTGLAFAPDGSLALAVEESTPTPAPSSRRPRWVPRWRCSTPRPLR